MAKDRERTLDNLRTSLKGHDTESGVSYESASVDR